MGWSESGICVGKDSCHGSDSVTLISLEIFNVNANDADQNVGPGVPGNELP